MNELKSYLFLAALETTAGLVQQMLWHLNLNNGKYFPLTTHEIEPALEYRQA